MALVVRAYWFRVRAVLARWTEEISLLTEEMKRVLRYFQHYEALWRTRAENGNPVCRGYASYCYRQAEHFHNLTVQSQEFFLNSLKVATKV